MVGYAQDMGECILIILQMFFFQSHHQRLIFSHNILWFIPNINQQGEFHCWYCS